MQFRTLILLFALSINSILAKDFTFRYYNVFDGLPGNMVFTIEQDNDGFMWFGTDKGLARFDGVEFKSLTLPETDSLKNMNNNSVYILTYDNMGKLWIGTSKGLFYYSPEQENIIPVQLINSQKEIIIPIIKHIALEGDSLLWISSVGQGLICYNLISKMAKTYLPNSAIKESLPSKTITGLLIDSHGDLWVSTSRGFCKYNRNTDNFTVYQHKPNDSTTLSGNDVQIVFEDRNGNLWVSTYWNGINKFNKETGEFTRYLQRGTNGYPSHLHDIEEYNKGELLISSDNGLTIFNYLNNEVKTLLPNANSEYGLNERFLYPIFVDKENGLWIGSYSQGINYYSPYNNRFGHISKESGGKIFSVMTLANDGNVWVGTQDGGLAYFDVAKNEFSSTKYPFMRKLSGFNIHALLTDGDFLWVGYYEDGLDRIHIPSNTVENFKNYPGNDRKLAGNSVYSLCKDDAGTMWVGTLSGLSKYNNSTQEFSIIDEIPRNHGIIQILQTNDGSIWLLTFSSGIFKRDPKSHKWMNYNVFSKSKGLTTNTFNCIAEFDNTFYAGTATNGVQYLDNQKDSFKILENEHLINHNISSIVPSNGKLWISTDIGLVEYSQDGNSRFFNFLAQDNQRNSFYPRAAILTERGNIIFGGTTGLNIVNPTNISLNKVEPNVLLTDMQISYHDVSIGTTESPLNKSITQTKSIVLNYNQSSVNFRFVSLSYVNPLSNQYRFKLEGFDNEWIENGTKNSANYTNLAPGKYVFKVMATNNDGVWSNKMVTLNIKVKPHILLSPIAITLYSLFVIMTVFSIIALSRKKVKIRHEEKIRELALSKEKELYHSKINFFTNIVHEIRTPLSLIIGPLENILGSKETPDSITEDLRLIERNSGRLLDLVNQLLDFRKIEHELFNLRPEKIDLNTLVFSIYERFKTTARINGTLFEINTLNCDAPIIADVEAAIKIISNILTNALKYTRDKVAINLIYDQNNRKYLLSVEDNGDGLSQDEIDKIFDPFYRSEKNKDIIQGTGLGLTLTKSLVGLLGWEIRFTSQINVGSKLTLEIPVQTDEEFLIDNSVNETINAEHELISNETETTLTILLVEDNHEIRNFVSKQLQENYNLKEASNGDDALNLLRNHLIDIVLTDIMMPGIDGIELCKIIKTNIETCHIPVIMLTAKTNIDSKLKSLEYGADAYIEKPFKMELLKAQINNIILNRENIRKSVNESPLSSNSKVIINSSDSGFIQRLNDYIIQNIDNTDMNIESLSNQLNMGRTSLFNKIKSISGMSPLEYVRLIRLKHAAELLLQGKYRINEISYIVGFNTPSYFSKCFYKQFGVLPNDYVKLHSKN